MKQLFFRQYWPLLLLVAAFIFALAASWWMLLQWQQQQLTANVQQLSNSVSLLAVQPLQHKQPDSLKTTMQALQRHSHLPVQAMAVFDLSQRVFVSTSDEEDWLGSAVIAAETGQQMVFSGGRWLVTTPIWADVGVAESGQQNSAVVSSTQLGYLLVLLDASVNPVLWPLLPLVLLLPLMVLLFRLGQQQWRDLQTRQIQQFVGALLHHPAASTSTDAMLQPLAIAWQQLSTGYDEKISALKQSSAVQISTLQYQTDQLQQKVMLAEQQNHSLQAQLQNAERQLQLWLELGAAAKQESAQSLYHKVRLLTLLANISRPDYLLQQDSVQLTSWLADCCESMASRAKPGIQLLFEEDPQALLFKVHFDPLMVSALCHIFAGLCAEYATEPEIVVGCRLQESPQKLLKISIRYVGHSIPKSWHQVLLQDKGMVALQQLDAEVARRLLHLMSASVAIDSLEDVGTHIELTMPVSWQKTNSSKPFQSVLLVDEKECRLSLGKQSLAAVGEQVHQCGSLAQLDQVLKMRLIDLVVLVLPDFAADTGGLGQLFVQLQQRYQLVCFASAQQQAYWQSIAGLQVQVLPVMVHKVMSALEQPQLIGQQQLLVVDDNLTNLSYVRAVLALDGLKIDIAMTGEEAIQMASSNRYQLILMDIQLPDLAGTEVTKQIRQLRHHQHTEILAFTAHALPEEVASFRLAGMDDVLIKPLDTQKIAHILAKLKASGKAHHLSQ